MSGTIYQVSDLANKRTDFVADARAGGARLRDKDGTSLVMLPESRIEHLEGLQEHFELFLTAERHAASSTPLDVYALGRHAWIRSLPAADVAELADELGQALVAAISDGEKVAVDEIVSDWRLTARQLEDPLRKTVLLGPRELTDFIEVQRPALAPDPNEVITPEGS